MDEEFKQKAIEYHKNRNGKIATELISELETKDDLSLAYSPGVGAVSTVIFENESLAHSLTLKGRTVGIISDGSAILGLGNLGAHAAIPVMEGKAALLKHFANVDAFPICLNTQDTDEIVEIVKNIAPVFGAINLEDISAPRCFEIEERLRETLNIPVMHDDQWGTATVVLSGIINALKISNKKIDEVKIVISGIGAAGVSVAKILFEYGAKNLVFVDSKGIINSERNDLTKEKIYLLNNSNYKNEKGALRDAISNADIFIGLSKPGVLTPEMVHSMNEKPIIFALANPIPEIMPEIAIASGAFVIATGRSDYNNQVNNALAFPGILKAAIEFPGAQFEIKLFIEVAKSLAAITSAPTADNIIPSIFNKEVVDTVYNTTKEFFNKQIALKQLASSSQ